MAGFGRSSSPWLYSSPGEYLGPLFHFSDTWQLMINTGTTIVTFLMVFLIQRTQNKDAQSIHLKLNEIVVAMEGASNRLVDVEHLTEDEIGVLHKHYQSWLPWPSTTPNSRTLILSRRHFARDCSKTGSLVLSCLHSE